MPEQKQLNEEQEKDRQRNYNSVRANAIRERKNLDKVMIVEQQLASEQSRSIGGLLAMLIIAGLKDLLDAGTLELASWLDWVIDIAIGLTMFLVFGRKFKKGMMKFSPIVSMALEAIPFVGILPMWSINAIYAWFKK